MKVLNGNVIFQVFTVIPVFLKKTLKTFMVEICVKIMLKLRDCGWDGRKVEMW